MTTSRAALLALIEKFRRRNPTQLGYVVSVEEADVLLAALAAHEAAPAAEPDVVSDERVRIEPKTVLGYRKLAVDPRRWNELLKAEAELAQARAEAEQLRAKLQNLAAEYYFLTHREYDDNARRAFDNRRKLARIVAANWLHLNEADTKAMVEAAAEHGGTGGELLNWYLARLRSEAEQLRQERDEVLDKLEAARAALAAIQPVLSREAVAALVTALRKLRNEASGFVAISDGEAVGWTNLRIMHQRIAEADAVLRLCPDAPKEAKP